MAKYKELIAWQKAHHTALTVYRVTERFPEQERFGLTSQLRRSALSIPTNIVEGHGRKNKKEFSHFLNIALGSQAEATYLIEFAMEMKLISTEEGEPLLDALDEVGRLIWSLRHSL